MCYEQPLHRLVRLRVRIARNPRFYASISEIYDYISALNKGEKNTIRMIVTRSKKKNRYEIRRGFKFQL